MIQLSFHRFVNRRRSRADDDTFPTLYRANTPEALQELSRAVGFVVERIHLVDGRPEYLRLSAPTYLIGWLIERMLTGVPPGSRDSVLASSACSAKRRAASIDTDEDFG